MTHTRALPLPVRLLATSCAALALAAGLWPAASRAACNVIPPTTELWRGARGSTDRPMAMPGDIVRISRTPAACVGSAGGFTGDPTGDGVTTGDDFVVTLMYTPPAAIAFANAVLVTNNCSSVAVSAARNLCDGGVKVQNALARAVCVDPASVGVPGPFVGVTPDGAITFRFPSTDFFVDAPDDLIGLAGPARIIVTRLGDEIPCQALANRSTTCATSGQLAATRACIDEYYLRDGTCNTNARDLTFPGFTALPAPNDYSQMCTTAPPAPCTDAANRADVRFTMDRDGNVLIPMNWGNVLPEASTPIPRLVEGGADIPAFGPPDFTPASGPIRIPGDSFVASYAPEGIQVPPVFATLANEGDTEGGTDLFGSVDAVLDVVRLARFSETFQECFDATGQAVGVPCNDDSECASGQSCQGITNDPTAGGTQRIAGRGPSLFDFANRASGEGCGPVLVSEYQADANNPVLIEALNSGERFFTFVRDEALEGVSLNSDSDAIDPVITTQDGETGETVRLGDVLGEVDSVGRAVALIRNGPFRFPALAFDDDILAFLEPQPWEGDCGPSDAAFASCDTDGNGDVAGTRLRVVRIGEEGPEEVLPPFPNPNTSEPVPFFLADAAPTIEGRPLVVQDGVVVFRRALAEDFDQRTLLLSQDADTGEPANGDTSQALLSRGGRFALLESQAEGLVPGFVPDGSDSYVLGREVVTDPGPPPVEFFGEGSSIRVADDASFAGYPLVVRFPDPVGDAPANTDVETIELLFNPSTGNYRVEVRAGSFFDGLIRVNFNVLNADADPASAFFTDNVNDFDLSNPTSILFLDGVSGLLADWALGDRVAPTDGPFGNPIIPPGIGGFNSGVSNLEAPGGGDGYAGDQFAVVEESGVTYPSFDGAISADGRFLVYGRSFGAYRQDRDPDGDGIFDEEEPANALDRVNVRSDGSAFGTSPAPRRFDVSDDGRFVAIRTPFSLEDADQNDRPDIYVRDVLLGTTKLASRRADGQASNGDGGGPVGAIAPRLSRDGRYLLFASDQVDLVPDDTNGVMDIFIVDRDVSRDGFFDEPGDTNIVRVNVASDGTQADVGAVFIADMSDDGRFAVFASSASLVPDDQPGTLDVFLHDRDVDGDGIFDEPEDVATVRVNNLESGFPVTTGALDPTISRNGRFVSYTSTAAAGIVARPGPFGFSVYVWDRITGLTRRASLDDDSSVFTDSRSAGRGSISPDGRHVSFLVNGDFRQAYLRGPGGGPGAESFLQVFVTEDVPELNLPGGFLSDLLGPAGKAEVATGVLAFLGQYDGRVNVATNSCSAGPFFGRACISSEQCAGAPCDPLRVVTYNDLEPDFQASDLDVSTSFIAALFSEPLAGDDFNFDDDQSDHLPAFHRLGDAPGSWQFLFDPESEGGTFTANEIEVAGSVAGFLTANPGRMILAELDQSPVSYPLSGLRASDFVFGPFGRVCTEDLPTACAFDTDCGDDEVCTAGGSCRFVGDPCDEFFECPGGQTCRVDLLVGIAASEPLMDANLNGFPDDPNIEDAGDPRLDEDAQDDVFHVFDFLTGRLVNSGLAVTACRLAACGPENPFECFDDSCRFLVREQEQGQGQDLNNNGLLDETLVVNFNVRSERPQVLGVVEEEEEIVGNRVPVLPNPLVITPPPEDPQEPSSGGTTIVTNGLCVEEVGPPGPLGCLSDQFLRNGVCQRSHGTCSSVADCPVIQGFQVPCQPVPVATGGSDRDGDQVIDSIDNCPPGSQPQAFNPEQRDRDGDGVGDRCDAATCGNGDVEPGEQCDDGNLSNGDGCDAFCAAEFTVCDVNDSGAITQSDIDVIFSSIGSASTPPDQRDFDGDGMITIFDARGCVNECTFLNCAEDGACGLLGVEPLLVLLPWAAARRRARARREAITGDPS